ncbi:MAG: hypothetical protein PUF50_08340 [Erysipelotrichaceae bacterium]|nr:hypothetical protein [Erysipelotrichaceae bacterium]
MKKRYVFLLLVILFFSLFQAETTIQTTHLSLNIWVEKLIPSLFFPTFCIRILAEYRIFHIIFNWLHLPSIWNMDSKWYPELFIGWIIGFPNFAIRLEEAHQQNKITNTACVRLLSSISICAFPFLWMTIGVELYGNWHIGFLLWIILISSNLFLLFLTKDIPLVAPIETNPSVSWIIVIQKHLLSTALTLFYIGGYILIIQISISLLPLFSLKPFAFVISEFASGTFYLFHTLEAPLQLPFIGALIAFGGLCVHLQTFSSISSISISYRKYLIFRLIQALYVFLVLLLMQLFF